MDPDTRLTILTQLLRQARRWFTRHPDRDDAVSVNAVPAHVLRWMRHTDHALLDDAADAPGEPDGRE